jgi:hypothetical protein
MRAATTASGREHLCSRKHSPGEPLWEPWARKVLPRQLKLDYIYRPLPMKTLRLIFFGMGLTCLLLPEAQVLSARRLTQRIAPLLPPPPSNGPRPASVPPRVVNALPPAKPPPARTGVQTQLAEEPNRPSPAESEPRTPPRLGVPLLIECNQVKPDPQQSLQQIELSLTNAAETAVRQLTMRLVYCDSKGEKLKEWITRRELDQPLAAKAAMELSQPAYFMPLTTKRVKVELLGARFADGSEWAPTANRPTSIAGR